jgi:hypothetical protein
VYYRKKLDYQEARVKELLKRLACMLTGLGLSKNFQTFIDENPGIMDYTWFSDEALFHLSGYVNSQNTRLWGTETPHAMFEEPLYFRHFWPPSAMFLWFQTFSLKVECSVSTAGFGHQTVQQTSSGNS